MSSLDIGRTASPPVPARQTASPPVPPRQNSSAGVLLPPPTASSQGSRLGELQNRFAKMSTPSAGNIGETTAPATGTSWAEKQAALRTASNLRDNPSQVTASDLRGAASTANNFQQRHGEQVASGWKAANGLNQKYGIAGRINGIASSSASPAPPQPPTQTATQTVTGGFGKKAPPPPPPKKKDLGGGGGVGGNDGSGGGASEQPPPIPLGSKPKF